MRWSWPFARRPNLPAAGSNALPVAARQDAGAVGAWTSLPPIQRTVGDARLTAPAAPFLSAVPGTRQLPQFLQPLGHDASPSGPLGLVVARARSKGGPGPRPVAESAAVPLQDAARPPEAARPFGQQPAPAASPLPAAQVSAAAPVTQAPQLEQPVRQLAVMQAATVAIPSVSLTRWEAAPARSQSARAAADAAGPGGGGMRRARPSESSDGPVASSRPSGTEDSVGSGPPVSEVALPPVVARRAGLGAPLAAVSPTLRHPAAAPDVRVAPPRPTAVQRSVGSPVGAAPTDSPLRSPGSSRGNEGPPDRRLPILSVARTAGRSPSGLDSVTAGQRPARLTPSPESPAPPVPAAPEVRATLGRRPLRPIARVQRASSDESSATHEAASVSSPGQSFAAATEGGTYAAPQRAGGPGIPSALALPLPGFRSDAAADGDGSGPPPVQRRAPQAHAAGPSTPAGHPTVQRLSQPSHPLVRPSVPAAEAEHRRIEGGAPPNVQTSASPPASASVLAPTVTQVVQRVDGAAPVPEAGPGRPSDRELDELARALFGRIRGQLRSELIHDREAKGLTFDNV